MTRVFLIAAVLWSAGFAANAQGDATKGERVFKKCAACHAIGAGKKKSGPHLQAILGREGASVEGFKYSKAMAAAGLTWDEETLRAFLTDPKGYVPKTKMSFAGIRKPADMDNLIEYLKGL